MKRKVNQRLVDKPVTVIDRDVVTVFELNLPFLVTGARRVAESGDASLQWKCERHKESRPLSLVVGIAFTKKKK